MTIAAMSFDPLLKQLRRRAWSQALVYAVAAAVPAGAIARLLSLSAFASAMAVGLAVLAWRRLADSAFARDATMLTAHLDRRLPELEESAGLWLQRPATLDVLQRMQRERITEHWSAIVSAPERWLPALRTEVPALLVAMGLLLFLFPGRQLPSVAVPQTASQPPAAPTLAPALRTLRVEPPPYTGLEPYSSKEHDVALPEGARLSWTFSPGDADGLRLAISDGRDGERLIALAPRDDGMFEGAVVLQRTSLYRVEGMDTTGYTPLPGVHTLTVTLDRPPELHTLEPRQTRVEIPRDAEALLDYRVSVTDDYGVADVAMLASVAKGSGEGVKFRDERLLFDRQIVVDGLAVHERRLRLEELGMEPGDEIYLFATATDNHPGEPQQGRSDTLVVRWLDELAEPEATDGLGISILPEYFKSQRQIIIETEELIADRPRLAPEEFEDAAQALGQAQSELKERYGQYLGDEFDEGDAPEGLDVAAGDAAEDEHEGHAGHTHTEAGQEPGETAGPATSGSAAELIERFAHNHGPAELGPITSRSPVGLMKRSVANMWEAELQLRLADPEAALPFENEALRYFDLARQAERIFTRRLGFEPPPVSEERRLSGDLDDIVSRERTVAPQPDPSVDALMRELFQFLNATPPGAALDDQHQLELLRTAAREFTARAEERPVLIEAAAELERLRVARRFEFERCPECLPSLRAATWSLLPAAEPGPGTARRSPTHDLGLEYLQRAGILTPAQADTR